MFRKLEVRQGTLAVTADEAVASPADFVDSRWTFTGNVVLRSGETEARGSAAELAFKDNVLRNAVLRGSPATFRQPRTDARLPTDGQANVLDYDPVAGRIRMTGNARLTDGPNEVKGDKIDYDLLRQVVSAGSGSGGPVRIRIMPPADAGKGAASPAPPAAPAPPPAPPPARDAVP